MTVDGQTTSGGEDAPSLKRRNTEIEETVQWRLVVAGFVNVLVLRVRRGARRRDRGFDAPKLAPL